MKLSVILYNTTFYYVLSRAVIWILLGISIKEMGQINYASSTFFLWYLTSFILPMLIAFLISFFWKREETLLTHIGKFMLPLLIGFTILVGNFNNNYWGYPFRRPAVFSELRAASTIQSISNIKKLFSEEHFKITIDSTFERRISDIYYDNLNRPIRVLHNNSILPLNWFQNAQNMISESDLISISNAIAESGLLIQPNREYMLEIPLKGRIIHFSTTNRKSYYYVCISGGEISNDHLPFYEILLQKTDNHKIFKSQLFFIDVAGMEGFEYASIAVLFEFLLLLGISPFFIIYKYLKNKTNGRSKGF